jgi:hypothetical protein
MDVRRLVAALMLLGSLVSCSDDEPTSDPQEPTSSATVSPSPTGPVIPAEARGTDETSAKAFVRYWFEVFNTAVNSGDPAPLMQLSTADCVSCKAFRRNIERAYSDGGRVRAVGWRPTSIDPVGGQAATFALSVRQGDEQYLNSSGDVVRHFAGGRRNMIIQLVRLGSIWRVERLEIER